MSSPLLTAVRDYPYILLVLAVTGIGFLVPEAGPSLKPLVSPLVVYLVYDSLNELDLGAIEVRHHLVALLAMIVVSYGLLPFAGLWLVDMMLAGGDVIGFAVILTVPTTAGSAIVWSRVGGFDVASAVTGSLASLLLAPLLTPVLLERLVGAQVHVPVFDIAASIAVIVVGGALLTTFVPPSSVPRRVNEHGPTFAIALLIYTSVASIEGVDVAVGTLPLVVGLSVVLLGLAFAVSLGIGVVLGYDRSRLVPLCFTSSLKNFGIAVLIALQFGTSAVMVVVITYYLTQQFVGAVVTDLSM